MKTHDITSVKDIQQLFKETGTPEQGLFVDTLIDQVGEFTIETIDVYDDGSFDQLGTNAASYAARIIIDGKFIKFSQIRYANQIMSSNQYRITRDLTTTLWIDKPNWDKPIGKQGSEKLYSAGVLQREPVSFSQIARLIKRLTGELPAAVPKCHKCGGSGRIKQYSHIEGGRCFACAGTGIEQTKAKP